MPNSLIIYYAVSFLLAAAFINTCAEEKNSPLVDQKYLQSNDYRSFKQKFRQEAVQKENQKRSLLAHLRELGNCKEVKPAALPLEINRKEVSAFLEASPEHCEQFVTSEELGFEIQLLREIRLKNYSLKLVLLKDESVYLNWQLLAVVFQNGKMGAYKRIGVFQKDPSKDIDTEILVLKKDKNLLIKSEIIRKIMYPIKQENTTVMQLVVSSKGIYSV